MSTINWSASFQLLVARQFRLAAHHEAIGLGALSAQDFVFAHS
jgi:hypothetical protein